MLSPRYYLVTVILGIVVLLAGGCAQLEPAPLPAPTPAPAPAPSPTPAPVPIPGGTIAVYVTDAPPREEVTSIMVTVAEVRVHKAVAEQEREQKPSGSENQTQEQEQQQIQQGEGGWITIGLGDAATTFDLLEIRGIEQFLGTSEVGTGKYTQVRLVVDKVQVALGSGELQEAKLPSKELKLVRPFEVVAGETTVIVLDFDADRMVTVTGAGKIMVKPVVKLTVRQEKTKDQKGEPKPPAETAEKTSVKVSCDDFIEQRHINKEVEVPVDSSILLTLCSNPTTGFQWESANISAQAVLEQVDHEFISPESEPPPPPGTPGQDVWTFKALKAGTSTISIDYSRPWEGGEKAEWTFILTVIVK
ncbi:DUF4382 domain-containing protein [Chloroflexota bacterium]